MGLAASQQGLDILLAHLIEDRRGWNRYDPKWADAAGVSISTLGRVWMKAEIRKDNFIKICRAAGVDWREIVNVEEAPPGALEPIKYLDRMPNVPTLYGRDGQLQNLEQLIADRYRLISLFGIVGTGKTALIVKLVERVELVEFQFDYLIWYSLDCAPPLKQVLINLLTSLDKNSNSISLQKKSYSELLSELMKFFHQNRCLLVLDKFDAILCSSQYAGGDYREGCSNYQDLLRRIGEEQHNSCLIITSRERAGDLTELEAKDIGVRSLKIEGLQEAGYEILRAKGLFGERGWKQLNRIYQSNPLFLKMIAEYIRERYNGDVEAFMGKTTTFMTRNIKKLVDQVIEHLSSTEKAILSELARQREPVSLTQLQEILSSLNPSELSIAIDSLIERSLIEKNVIGFELKPIVREYVN